VISDGEVTIQKYWDVSFEVDFDRSESEFVGQIQSPASRAVEENLTSDVEVGAYVSGGVDSSLVYLLANQLDPSVQKSFHGRFTDYPGFDESHSAEAAVRPTGGDLNVLDIGSHHLKNRFRN